MPKKLHIPADRQAEYDRLKEQVRHAEQHGQYDTAHHEMLRRLEIELGLIPTRKTEEPTNEVNNG